MKVNLNDASDPFIMSKAAGASPTNGKKHVNNNSDHLRMGGDGHISLVDKQ